MNKILIKRDLLIFFVLLAFGLGCIFMWNYKSYDKIRGAEIASGYIGVDAGFTRITLYEHNLCKREYGGIFGPTDAKYYGYTISGDTIVIQTKEDIHHLRGMEFQIDSQSFRITNLRGN